MLVKKDLEGSFNLDSDEVSTVASFEDVLDLDALNLICSEVAEGLGDGGCDPVCIQTPVSRPSRSCRPKKIKKKNNKINKSK
jgi:hypothetical protein